MKTCGDTAKKEHPVILKRLRRQKPLMLAFCMVFAIVMVLGSTMAWFTASDTRVNKMQRADLGGDFTVVLVDIFDPLGNDGKFSKSVGAVNEGTVPGFVRLLVTPVFVIEGQGDEPDTLLPAQWGEHVFIDDLNTDDWIDGDDGYFYYKHIVNPGESTNTVDPITGKDHNLFNTVSIPEDIPEGYENAVLKIEVKCEAVDTEKWNYRDGWWLGTTPANEPLKSVDDALKTLAK